MIKSVTAFVTADDKIHLTKEDAIKHQKMLDLTTQATEFARLYYPDDVDPAVAIIIEWEQKKPVPKVTLSQLELSQRAYLALNTGNITTVDELVKYSRNTLREFPNVNARIITEIQDALAKHDLALLIEFEEPT